MPGETLPLGLVDCTDERQKRPPAGRRFKLVPFNEVQCRTDPAYIVKGIIPREGLTVIWGPPKCGKTFWAFDVALHVALGRSYHGRRVQQGPVVYIACEGERGLGARTEAWRRHHLGGHSGSVPFWLITTRLDLVSDHEDLVADIHAQIGSDLPVLIIIDTLNRSLRGSESDDAHMGAYVKAADAVREAFECSVAIVHHCGVEPTRPRGHTSLTGAADAQIAVKSGPGATFTVTVEHMKDGAHGDQLRARLETVAIGSDEDGDDMTSCVVEPEEGQAGGSMSKLSGLRSNKHKLVLKVITDLIEREGEGPPASTAMPRTVRVVKLANAREAAREKGWGGSKPDTFRRTFDRAVVRLQELELIGKWGDWIWLLD